VKEVIEQAAKVIANGGVILYPTDTVWGLGCDPKNDKAIQRIAALKGRSTGNGMILLVDGWPMLERYVNEVPEICYDLADFAVKPLTIIYPQGRFVSNLLKGSDGSLAVRIVKHEFCAALMKKTRYGIVSTSANLTGEAAPARLSDVVASVLSSVDYVVNLPDAVSDQPPSQIIKVGPNNEIKIIRK
jgi:L-threonylcarbamoyladenylate synthase